MLQVTMAWISRFLVILTLALAAAPAGADEVVYPPGSRVGLVPPPGMVPSQNFIGFEDRANNVAVIMAGLPVEAYADLAKSVTAPMLKKQGVTLESRETLTLPTGKAILLIARQQIQKVKLRKVFLLAAAPALTALVTVQIPETARERYPDAAVRATLATLAVRATIPVDEQLSLLPFKVTDLAGFRLAGLIPGRAVLLSDAANTGPPAPGSGVEPHIFAAIAPGGPDQASDRDHFARDIFSAVPNLKSVRITASEPLRIGGAQGHQIFANAKDPSGAGELSIVQWLRFGGGGYLQLVGVSRAEAWREAYPRFRSVRDGIEPR
jgi:hypothetical protein